MHMCMHMHASMFKGYPCFTTKSIESCEIQDTNWGISGEQVPGCACAGGGDGQTEQSPIGSPET